MELFRQAVSGLRRVNLALIAALAVMFDGFHNLSWRRGAPGRPNRIGQLVAAGVAPAGGAVSPFQELVQTEAELTSRADAVFNRLSSKKSALRQDPENASLLTEVESLTGEYDAVVGELKAARADLTQQDEHRKLVKRDAQRTFDADKSDIRISGLHDRREDDPKRGFANLADFALSVRSAYMPSGERDERLNIVRAAPTNFHRETGASEGYHVPPEFSQEIFELAFPDDGLVARFNPEPTSSNSVEKLADETTPWGSTGVQASWRSEGNQMTATKLATEKRHVDLHELYAFVLATEELLQDAPRLNSRLTRAAGRAINWKVADSLIYGTGAGQPYGYFNHPALVSVAKEGSQAADTIDDQNLLKMYARLLRAEGSRPFWMANPDTVPQLAAITIGDQPAWIQQNAGLREAPNGMLLGFPLVFSEHGKTLGDKGDIHLVDPSGYYALRRTGGPEFASSMHLFFDYNIQAFRWVFRFGGEPFLDAPVDPANGSNSKSHFVVLDERA